MKTYRGERLDQRLWGHSLTDYLEMFSLSQHELEHSILDYGAVGSFNMEMHEQGKHVISCDAFYAKSLETITKRIDDAQQTMRHWVNSKKKALVWERFSSPEQYVAAHRTAIKKFLEDLSSGLKEGRYLPYSVPSLPFSDYQFELALCCYPSFGNQPLEIQQQAIRELCRVASEVRIFPVTQRSNVDDLLGPLMLQLQMQNYGVEIRQVAYTLQPSTNAMLRVWSQECLVAG